MKKLTVLCLLLATGCASMPVQPIVDAKLNDLNRRVAFLYELQRGREITPERCAWFSGPEMTCAKNKEKHCQCVLAEDGFGIAPEPVAEETKPEAEESKE